MTKNPQQEHLPIFLPTSISWLRLIAFLLLGLFMILIGFLMSENPLFENHVPSTIVKASGGLLLILALILNLQKTHFLKLDHTGFTRVIGPFQFLTKWDDCSKIGLYKHNDGNWWQMAMVGYTLHACSGFLAPLYWCGRRITGFDAALPSNYGVPYQALADIMEALRTSGNLRNAEKSIRDVSSAEVMIAPVTASQKAIWLIAIGLLCYTAFIGVLWIVPNMDNHCFEKNTLASYRLKACSRIISTGQYGAYGDFTTAIDMKTKDHYPFSMRGTVQAKRGEFKKAVTDYTASLVLEPNDVYVLHMRAKAYKALGKSDEAYDGIRVTFKYGGAKRIKAMERMFRKHKLYDGPIDGVFSNMVDTSLKACIAHSKCMTF